MKSQHINPEEAFKIHKDIKAKLSLGVHWGTFNLSHEVRFLFKGTKLLQCYYVIIICPSFIICPRFCCGF